MKHSAKFTAATLLVTFTLFTQAVAQEKNAIAVNQSATNHTFHIKEDSQLKTIAEANPVVTAKFSALFPTASGQKWITGEDHSWVSFLNNGRNAKASFTQKGKLSYLITDCAMEHLPAAFSKSIANDYASYQLFNAIEITAHGTMAYQAILENSEGYITLKFTADGVEEVQQVKKQ